MLSDGPLPYALTPWVRSDFQGVRMSVDRLLGHGALLVLAAGMTGDGRVIGSSQPSWPAWYGVKNSYLEGIRQDAGVSIAQDGGALR